MPRKTDPGVAVDERVRPASMRPRPDAAENLGGGYSGAAKWGVLQ